MIITAPAMPCSIDSAFVILKMAWLNCIFSSSFRLFSTSRIICLNSSVSWSPLAAVVVVSVGVSVGIDAEKQTFKTLKCFNISGYFDFSFSLLNHLCLLGKRKITKTQHSIWMSSLQNSLSQLSMVLWWKKRNNTNLNHSSTATIWLLSNLSVFKAKQPTFIRV